MQDDLLGPGDYTMPKRKTPSQRTNVGGINRSTKSKATKGKGKSIGGSNSPVVYPEIKVEIRDNKNPITFEEAKRLLGYEEETENTKFGSGYLADIGGVKFRCTKNSNNRRFRKSNCLKLRQELLNRRWKLNGIPIIIGNKGNVINGQHRLIMLLLAVHEWTTNQDRYKSFWATEPTLQTIIEYGISEDDDTVNTYDTGLPRSLTDVIYRSGAFKNVTDKQRNELSKVASGSIKLLWDRTGVRNDAYSPRYQTHAESINFLERHPRLLDCVKHIYEEDTEGRLSRFLSAGYSAGLMYLMAASDSDSSVYHAKHSPDESLISWDQWDKASEFFVELAGGAEALKPVRQAYVGLLQREGGASQEERRAILVKAWNRYKNSKKITDGVLKLDYVQDDDGVHHLVEVPTVGGIDVGDGEAAGERKDSDPTESEIKNEGFKIRHKKKDPTVSKPNGYARKGSMAGKRWSKDDTAWLRPKGEDPVYVTLTQSPIKCNDGKTRVMVQADDGNWEVELGELFLTAQRED